MRRKFQWWNFCMIERWTNRLLANSDNKMNSIEPQVWLGPIEMSVKDHCTAVANPIKHFTLVNYDWMFTVNCNEIFKGEKKRIKMAHFKKNSFTCLFQTGQTRGQPYSGTFPLWRVFSVDTHEDKGVQGINLGSAAISNPLLSKKVNSIVRLSNIINFLFSSFFQP